ncbi:hypothetical protein M409DRAFT_15966 [Zasmidium cellare ATCC 36951]|uniref:Heterokaryon incompatibility domain-containing protein n=1 Tax=Zasmidium cellare ATCC 36951 TaxID=1080233 RepID=A0A6A6D2S5_ZASCE|nr:uncharacterized protein M409DRAFT_15966 [Zasmidium cellare ATCC 36951]KAF2173691.1 hypothetical protein M409DRAFT_15966 [Zasmidium cellare ATCC 36951]
MGAAYTYDRFSDPQRQIRLLHLHCSDDRNSSLTGQIEIYNVPTDGTVMEPRFEALSYTWGSATANKQVFVNDETLMITDSLESFLRVRRQPQQELVFWVDAICINQQDVEEKSQQIPLMGFIYTLACKVTIWLGPRSDDSDFGMQWLNELGEDSPYAKMPLLSSKSLRAVQNILLRPWWTRMWIVQEIVSGGFHFKMHHMHLMCGDRAVSWMNLVIAAARMRAYQDDQRQFFPNIDRILELDALRDSPLGLRLAGPYRVYVERSLYSPVPMLARCRRYDATDPRDKVYAIYNLISESIPGLDRPDYRASVEEVYTNLAISRYEQDDVKLLTYCGPSSLDAPSWVPDWSLKPRCRPLPTGTGLYSDVPWWCEPPDDSAPQTEEYGPYRDALGETRSRRIVQGYIFRGYHFHGYNAFGEQMAFEKALRVERLELAVNETKLMKAFEALSPSADASKGPRPGELAELDTIVSAMVREVYARASKSTLSPQDQPGPLKEGELVTERQQKTKLLRSLEYSSPPYAAGGDVSFKVIVDSATGEANVSGVLWDTIDTVHSEPFPDDIEGTWQNATLFMVAVGLCKALATNHQAARERYPDIRSRMMAFWSTLLAGQILLIDQSHVICAGGEKMDYMNWLPEIDKTWSERAPPLTPMTSGLIHLQQVVNDNREAAALLDLKTFVQHDWLHGTENEDRKRDDDESHVNEDVQNLLFGDWSQEEGASYEKELSRLGSLWRQQPYDLYHRPFSLLNVVPDPFWEDRKERDELAKRKTFEHKPLPMTSPGPGIQPGSPEYGEYEKIAQRIQESAKRKISLDPPGTLDIGIEQYALGRRFFITEKGYFGLGPETVRPGDRIAVFFGLSVPLVLRDHEESGFPSKTVLGETYVHGVMDGEVLQQWRDGCVEHENVLLR